MSFNQNISDADIKSSKHLGAIDTQLSELGDEDLSEGVVCNYCGMDLTGLHVSELLQDQ